MIADDIKVYTEKDFLEHLIIGHPYHPKNPAILFLKKGHITLKEQIHRIELCEQSAILIDTNSVYEYLHISEGIELYMLIYKRSYVEKLTLKFNRLSVYQNVRQVMRSNFRLDETEISGFWSCLTSLKFFLKQYPASSMYSEEIVESLMSAILYQLAGIVSEANNEDSRSAMTRSEQIVLQFIKLVSDNYLEEKSVGFYAEKMFLSTRHLSSVVKEVTGKTANQIITEFTLNEAKALLSSTIKPVNEIAYLLKFSDVYSFSHFIKKHLQLSPTDYRNQFRK